MEKRRIEMRNEKKNFVSISIQYRCAFATTATIVRVSSAGINADRSWMRCVRCSKFISRSAIWYGRDRCARCTIAHIHSDTIGNTYHFLIPSKRQMDILLQLLLLWEIDEKHRSRLLCWPASILLRMCRIHTRTHIPFRQQICGIRSKSYFLNFCVRKVPVTRLVRVIDAVARETFSFYSIRWPPRCDLLLNGCGNQINYEPPQIPYISFTFHSRVCILGHLFGATRSIAHALRNKKNARSWRWSTLASREYEQVPIAALSRNIISVIRFTNSRFISIYKCIYIVYHSINATNQLQSITETIELNWKRLIKQQRILLSIQSSLCMEHRICAIQLMCSQTNRRMALRL